MSLVEARGIEPLSENLSTGLSPSADDLQISPDGQAVVRLRSRVASLCMARSKLCALTDATDRRPVPARGPSGRDGQPYAATGRELLFSVIFKVCRFYRGPTPLLAGPASRSPSKPLRPRMGAAPPPGHTDGGIGGTFGFVRPSRARDNPRRTSRQ